MKKWWIKTFGYGRKNKVLANIEYLCPLVYAFGETVFGDISIVNNTSAVKVSYKSAVVFYFDKLFDSFCVYKYGKWVETLEELTQNKQSKEKINHKNNFKDLEE